MVPCTSPRRATSDTEILPQARCRADDRGVHVAKRHTDYGVITTSPAPHRSSAFSTAAHPHRQQCCPPITRHVRGCRKQRWRHNTPAAIGCGQRASVGSHTMLGSCRGGAVPTDSYPRDVPPPRGNNREIRPATRAIDDTMTKSGVANHFSREIKILATRRFRSRKSFPIGHRKARRPQDSTCRGHACAFSERRRRTTG